MMKMNHNPTDFSKYRNNSKNLPNSSIVNLSFSVFPSKECIKWQNEKTDVKNMNPITPNNTFCSHLSNLCEK